MNFAVFCIGEICTGNFLRIELHKEVDKNEEYKCCTCYNRSLDANEIKQNFSAQGLAVVSPIRKLAGTWGEINF